MNELKEHYSQEVKALTDRIQHLRHKNRMYIILELTNFILAVGFFALYCLKDLSTPYIILTAVFLLFYFLVRRADVLNDKTIKILVKQRIVYSRELSYLKGDFAVFDDGARYVDPQHAFTFDMDVFGRDSLFNRINRTVTTGGSDRLARSLGELPTSVDDVEERRRAVDELSENETWRTEFLARGQRLTQDGQPDDRKIDSAAILNIINEVKGMRFPRRFKSETALILAFLSLLGFYLSIILAIFTPFPAAVAGLWGVVQMFVVLALSGGSLRNISKMADKLNKQMQSYVSLIRHIHAAEFKSAELQRLQNVLFDDDSDALESFSALAETINRIDRRSNELGLIVFNITFLNDFFIVRGFLRWQELYMDRMPEWIDTVSRIDALCSMAVLRYNRPEAPAAELSDADKVVLEASGLYHPFLGVKAVSNDFSVEDGNYYIITGANMAGKSTFLRSVGINYILAMNGMPVFARSLKVSLFNLFSSMRTTDDLSHGISYFNAELLRLGQLIESCKQHPRTLIILDEILKGTNSLDKLNGSRLFLTEISRLPVTGIIATHDLELSKMENEVPGRFHNYCFEIQLSENITYTYKITPGVARNQNATFLLRRIIKDI